MFQSLSNKLKRRAEKRKNQHRRESVGSRGGSSSQPGVLFGNFSKKKGSKKKNSTFSFSLPFISSTGKPLILFLILLIFVSALGFSGFTIKQYLSLNFNSKTTWNGESKINVLIVGLDKKENDYVFADYIAVMMLDPNNTDLGIFTIDPDIAFSLNGEIDTTLRKAYNLRSNGEQGIENIIYGVEHIIAIEVDKYVYLNEDNFIEISSTIGGFRADASTSFVEYDYDQFPDGLEIEQGSHIYSAEKILGVMAGDESGLDNKLDLQTSVLKNAAIDVGSISQFIRMCINFPRLESMNTNFSRTEFYKFFMFLNEINSADIKVGFTRQSSLMAGDPAAGGGKEPLYENVDKDVQSIFLNSDIAKERVQLEVLNATDVPNLATRYSRFFNNSGMRVVRTGNSIQPVQNNVLFVKNPDKYPYSIEQIKSIFNGDVEIIEQDYKYKHIGEVVLVIGIERDQVV